MATLICAMPAGCTGSGTPGASRTATQPPSHSPASGPRVLRPPGSAGNPVIMSCLEPDVRPSQSFDPEPRDLVVGPLDTAAGKALATMTSAEHGYSGYGNGGRFYKMGLALARGSTATVTIAPPARGHVVIAIWSPSGVTSATYRSCARYGLFVAQGFAFTHRPYRGCVPLDVTIDNRPPVHHVTMSLFAGPCTLATSVAHHPVAGSRVLLTSIAGGPLGGR